MEFTGKVIQVLPEESGTSRAGNPWRKKSWVLETMDQYPRKVKVDAMGRSLDNVNMELMKTYTCSVDAESREYNGRWYTDLRVYRAVEAQNGQQPATPDNAFGQTAPQQPAADPFGGSLSFPSAPEISKADAMEDPADDLPF